MLTDGFTYNPDSLPRMASAITAYINQIENVAVQTAFLRAQMDPAGWEGTARAASQQLGMARDDLNRTASRLNGVNDDLTGRITLFYQLAEQGALGIISGIVELPLSLPPWITQSGITYISDPEVIPDIFDLLDEGLKFGKYGWGGLHITDGIAEMLGGAKGGVKFAPVVGAIIGTILDYVTTPHKHGEEAHDLTAALISNGLQGVVAMNPYGAAALAINSGVQVGGEVLVWSEGEFRSIISDPEMRRNLDEQALTLQDVKNADITKPFDAAGQVGADYFFGQPWKMIEDVPPVLNSIIQLHAGIENLEVKLVTGVPSHLVAGVDSLVSISPLPQWAKNDFHNQANDLIATSAGAGKVAHGVIEIEHGDFSGFKDVASGGSQIAGGIVSGVADVGKTTFDVGVNTLKTGSSVVGWVTHGIFG